MKKLLGILVLGLLWCNTGFAEILRLKCIYKYVDEQYPLFEVGDDSFYKYDLNSKQYIVTDEYIMFYSISTFGDGDFFASYTQTHRYTGQSIWKSAEVPKDEIQDLLNLDLTNQSEKTFYKIFHIVNKWFIKNKSSPLEHHDKPAWIEYKEDCVKAKKQF